MTPRSIAELPFRERPIDELLALDRDADDPDPGFSGYGWARADEVWLEAAHGPRRRVTDALLIAVHSADDGPALADDIELEFELEPGQSVTALASTFLDVWLPRLPADAAAIVVVACNPHRAALRRPPAAGARPLHHATGDVVAWLDPPRRIRLSADAWRTLSTDAMTAAISDEEKQTYAGIWLLKKMDLAPKDGGMVFPVVLPSELTPLDEIFHELAVADLVLLNARKERWDLTKKGIAYLGELIDEASDLVDELDEMELADAVAELRRRNLDPFRARFLWGWYEGELDDLVLFQQRRGVRPVEELWAYYLTGDDFWNELAKDLG